MIKYIAKSATVRALFTISSLFVTSLALGQSQKEVSVTDSKNNQIEIKDFHFTPEVITVKSGEKITWINHDEEPHTIVSVEKQFKKSPALDTDQQFSVTAGAPGKYTYFCSVHPKMTGTIVVEK